MNHLYFRRPIAIILSLIISALIIIGILLFTTDTYDKQKNQFSRSFGKYELDLITSTDLSMPFFEISGASDQQIYLRSHYPDTLFSYDYQLNTWNKQFLDYAIPPKLPSRFKFQVDNPNVIIFGGNVPTIIKISLAKSSSPATICYPSDYIYSRAVQLDRNRFLVRGFVDKSISNQTFYIYDLHGGIVKTLKPDTSETGSALISDGLLHYDQTSKRGVFIHFYDSEFLLLNDSLASLSKRQTIDQTTSTLHVATRKTGNKVRISNASPRRLINRESFVHEGKLYVRSMRKAANESKREFNRHAVIDVYDLRNGTYLSSFHLPYNKDQLVYFYLYQDNFIALYKQHLAIYQLTEPTIAGSAPSQ